MKYLVKLTPREMPIPLDQGAKLYQATLEWMEAHQKDGTIECAYALVQGGGLAIANAESPEELWETHMTYPLQPYFIWEFTPLVDLQHVLRGGIEMYKRLTA